MMATKHCPNPGGQLAGIAGFGKIVVRANLEPQDPVDIIPFRRQHQNRYSIAGGPQIPADLQAATAREHQVEDHEINRPLCKNILHLTRIGCDFDVKALPFEICLEQGAQPQVIVHEQ